MSAPLPPHRSVVIIGGGQAGLAMAATLRGQGIDHIVLERYRIAHHWRTQRWDSFCLVTPNWQCRLPGFPYDGPAPDGFMPRDEIVAYIERFADFSGADIREGVAATRLARNGVGAFAVETTAGTISADAVVLAVSAYHVPNIPRLAERLPESIAQLHSSAYRNPLQMPPGATLVVGTGQSGCQIAEDLHLAGRLVHLAVGSAPRSPRLYRGRDAVAWLSDLGQYDMPVEQHPLGEKVRRRSNHYFTGRDGGRDIDLRRFAAEGMVLHGRLSNVTGGRLHFADDLAANLDAADRSYNGICEIIDRHIEASGIKAPPGCHYTPVWCPPAHTPSLDPLAADITGVVWATGFRSDWSWVELPIFDGTGYPTHRRGVTSMPGLYVLGLPWLNTWGSGRFEAVGRDAAYLGERIAAEIPERAVAD
jgi:putative flavoprotein involved in K+ transport